MRASYAGFLRPEQLLSGDTPLALRQRKYLVALGLIFAVVVAVGAMTVLSCMFLAFWELAPLV